jgi:ribosome biogenesis GTPase
MNIEELGWREPFISSFNELGIPGTVPGRVVWQGAFDYRVQGEFGEAPAELTGKLKGDQLPAVGDWVAFSPAEGGEPGVIQALLPRRSSFSRNAPGKAVQEQVAAANIDQVFVVCGLDRDYNLRRIERYITLVYGSAASPVVVLTKADLGADPEGSILEVEAIAPGVPVHAVSSVTGLGMDQLKQRLLPGHTTAFLGSSGAGKSTLINRILGREKMAVASVRDRTGKGRHTTTHRELFLLPQGGAVIDTPGMREIKVWGDGEGLSDAFPEIEELSARCRFRDCRHESEVGCAVKAAVKSGDLPKERLESYLKLKGEFESLERRQGPQARILERKEGKRFAKMVREVERQNPKRRG